MTVSPCLDMATLSIGAYLWYSISSHSPAFIYCVSILCCIYSLCIHPLSSLSTEYPSSPVFNHCVSILSGPHSLCIQPLWSLSSVCPPSPTFIYFVSTLLHSSVALYPGLSGLHTLCILLIFQPILPSFPTRIHPPPPLFLLQSLCVSLRELKSSIYQWKVVCEIEPSHYLSTFYLTTSFLIQPRLSSI